MTCENSFINKHIILQVMSLNIVMLHSLSDRRRGQQSRQSILYKSFTINILGKLYKNTFAILLYELLRSFPKFFQKNRSSAAVVMVNCKHVLPEGSSSMLGLNLFLIVTLKPTATCTNAVKHTKPFLKPCIYFN